MARFLGIDIGARTVRAALITTGYRRLAIERLAEAAIEGPDLVASAIAAAASSLVTHIDGMEAALADGKLAEVLAQAQKLPPKAAEPAGPWLAKVEARAAVDRALSGIEDQLKASLSGKAPVEKRTQ